MVLPFTKAASARKKLRLRIKYARSVYNMQRDTVPQLQADALAAAIGAASQARKLESPAELDAASSALDAALDSWQPLFSNSLAENFEVLVVALGVAMAFRCYFFQPFKIPTGSMQPTLYGIHSVEMNEPTFWTRKPFAYLAWLVTGDWYEEVRVTVGGPLRNSPVQKKDGYITFEIGGNLYSVPSDAIIERGLKSLRGLRPDGTVASGSVLWSGITRAGDHLFVNRMTWNFRKPRRGDVMVFSTRDIDGLPQGTHYIKRMTGLPGETVSIDPPYLVVDGERAAGPETIDRIQRKDPAPRGEPGYPNFLGYQVIGNYPECEAEVPLRTPHDAARLGDGEYFAMGDNTGNSRDSRYWGPVPARNLLGPGAFVYWPFTSKRFGLIR